MSAALGASACLPAAFDFWQVFEFAPRGGWLYTAFIMMEATHVTCPYCGERVPIELDPSGGTRQEYESECEVCCRPIVCHITVNGGEDLDVAVHTETDHG